VPPPVPPEQSSGWTLWLMDRASRFLWEGDGGKKDRRLLTKARKTVATLARQPHELRILTAGARRDGPLLFAIGHARVHQGHRGRPKKTCTRGVHVRRKPQGAPAHTKGRKRPQDQRPWRAHPATARPMAETDIHAKHAEAFWSALRRTWAPFRRKTTMDAKATTGWQRR
jgi:hypothetical protein